MINVGVIGCGHWGPNHIRIFTDLPDVQVPICCDLDKDRLASIQSSYPNIQTTDSYQEILGNDDIQAVCIASPTSTHFSLAKEALEHDKHVLCEKPLAFSANECVELHQLAEEKKKVLMAGHVFLFNPGILKLKEYIQSGELGQIYYAHSERTNLGPFRYDVNALWDLAPHDISIFNFLFDRCPAAVSARGQRCLGNHHEDLAFVTLNYPDNILVNVHVSWLDPKKVRQITIVGDKKMVVWDDLDDESTVKLYDKHVEKTAVYYETFDEFQLLSKEGNIDIPKIDKAEPLTLQDAYFIECINKNRHPDIADGKKAADISSVLAAAQDSITKEGASVTIG